MFGFFKDRANKVGDVAKRVVGVEEIKNNFNYIKDGSKILFNVQQQSQVREVGVNQKKKFKDIIKDNGYTKDDLNKMHQRNASIFYILFIGFLCCLGSAVYSFTHQATFDIILQFFPSIGVGILMLSLMMRFGLVAYQIEHENLVSVQEYLKSGKEIFPKFKIK